ncbi:MAG: radical SAM family heme chaperone HemW [Acidimicrobiales bacterium]
MDDFGLYIHVPFCASRCDYCAFATWTDRDPLMEPYVEACVTELRRARAEGMGPASTVFVGGGTPSRLAPELFGCLLGEVQLQTGAEVTAECNPDDADPELLGAWRDAGVNRVSFGVQSMQPHVLAGLGRRHDPAAVARAMEAARTAGIDDCNIDLIYGTAVETDEDWDATLQAALALGPTHVSAYALTIEPGTPLAADTSRHPDDDVQARRYEHADTVLGRAGFEWYELSNWALPGHQCRHNRLYWSQGDYRGIGCAAHSHLMGRRFWNIRTPERYIEAVRGGKPTVAGEEVLDDEGRRFERLALSLRTSLGVPADALDQMTDLDDLVTRRDGVAVLTLRGRLLANEVTARLEVPTTMRP